MLERCLARDQSHPGAKSTREIDVHEMNKFLPKRAGLILQQKLDRPLYGVHHFACTILGESFDEVEKSSYKHPLYEEGP